MRVLFVTWAGGGNVPPAAAISAELSARGHDVAVLGHAAVRREFPPDVAFRVFDRAPDFVDSKQVGADAPEPRTPLGAFAYLRDRLLLGPADRIAADTRDQIAAFDADVVVVDFMLVGGLVAGEAACLPTFALMHTIYSLPQPGIPPLGLGLQPARGPVGRTRDALLAAVTRRLWNRGLPDLNRARSAFGLPPLADVFDQLDRVTHTLVTTSPLFDFDARPVDDRRTYVGLQRSPGSREPHWRHPREDLGGAPLVVASYSTTDQDQLEPLRRVAAALGRLPVRGLVTCGPVVNPRDLDAPANVYVEPFVDHSTVLDDAAVLVSHGGHGSVLGALASGVPVVCVPQGRDQHDVAARLTATGAGITVPARAGQRRLARAIGTILSDDRYRRAAGAVAEAIAAEAIACSADVIEAIAQRQPPRRTVMQTSPTRSAIRTYPRRSGRLSRDGSRALAPQPSLPSKLVRSSELPPDA